METGEVGFSGRVGAEVSVVFALWLACSGGADLSEGTWHVSALVGAELVDHEPGCTLAFTTRGIGVAPDPNPVLHELAWDEPCGRSDLPDRIGYTAKYPGVGRRYLVLGPEGAGTDAQWITRDGDHPDLYDLWVYDVDDEIGPANYDAEQVAQLW